MQVAGHFVWQPWFIAVAGTRFGMVYISDKHVHHHSAYTP
jgi:hypothetical protein